MERGRDYLALLLLVGAGALVWVKATSSQPVSRAATGLGGYTAPGSVLNVSQEGRRPGTGQLWIGIAPTVSDPVPAYTGPPIVPSGQLGSLGSPVPPRALGTRI